ncbi:MAG: hypothetical protein RB191_11865, partial [Terriglobia bacterium]|nr:hypothetical protein [Terriglobia bacterium]
IARRCLRLRMRAHHQKGAQEEEEKSTHACPIVTVPPAQAARGEGWRTKPEENQNWIIAVDRLGSFNRDANRNRIGTRL